MFSLAVVQILTAIFFYQWALTNTTDAATYYFDPYDFYQRGFQLNTGFIIWIVQSLKGSVGGSYLDYFLLFQASGTWGLVFLLKIYEDIFKQAGQTIPWPLYLTLFLPGFHFWTAYIGKDGLLFLASAMTVWAAINLRERWVAFGIAVVIMILVRPHIALLAVAAGAVAIAFDRRTPPLVKIALSLISFAGLIAVAGTIRNAFQIDVTSAESVTDFLSTYSQTTQGVTGTTTVAYNSYLVRVFSLLFRPLFFDAGGMLGLIASFENLFLVYLVYRIVSHFRWVVALYKGLFVIRFSVLFALALTLLLAMMYYNVGLGLRQKLMMMPAYFAVFAAVVATAQRHRAALAIQRPRRPQVA
ncbi:MAG TPA: hypothetical protein VGC46_04445 [Allosphingosinicella sp.]